MIEANNVSKSFGEHLVLDNVSCRFEESKCNLIIGQSGSGKTVLMKCLVGLFTIDKGNVEYDGRVFSKMSFDEMKVIRQEIGMMFQGGALFDSMNVEENIMFPLSMFTDQSLEEKRERANFCLSRVRLENVNKLFPAELSGGMKKRVAIARAIAMNPRYLFCDEPNSGLDPLTANVIDNLISEITQEYNITTVINTHDMNSVIEIGDKIAYVHKGKLWWEGNKDTILKSDNPELNEFVFATELTRKLK
ncbi:ATP-binding cassette domain-containing protein [Lentimicrobium sp.]|mgnify:CR=1 FL=1|jgi:phospholipid/cholesterol/gamma-HCH transport system ATP-binding protein|uniref:ABC transporter ATP-binding protein n=1 Tax=Lentimicrobium sp. TaxID=2034841 RepID=UPI002BE39180|nr:ATP-binding cassette domain-containing protein [Lentimicrobium sp.]MCO5263328.1 ATP-binding cassette domain-containing protein [Lentimicrobium sp.]HPJ63589.1 ATP-binding cassette domain-containing protein [Lentimicrobium sp.]HPR27562.1 ATP-binding cassette domain-containing protein [Lentimicrobium sp.]HRW70221.1 ATP-binding cassette domain-containing protein [Lentimicrobium sp.]